MTAPTGSLRAEIAAAVRDRRLATLDELGPDAVFWLAAPPLWTLGAAEGAGFPVNSVTEFVRQASDAGWCKARGSLRDGAPGDLLFWMPDEVRREVIDTLAGRFDGATMATNLIVVANRIAAVLRVRPQSRSRTAEPHEDDLPGALRAWAALMEDFRVPTSVPASRAGSLPVGRGDLVATAPISTDLVLQTQRAVEARDLGHAQDLVAAGEAVAGILAGSTEQALSRARRLLALGLRRRQDERVLGRYLDRPELSSAMARLLNRHAREERPQWALHLRGVGGVGKTMLIRYLASGRYAADRGLPPIPVARVDFDHIGPDYPVRRPVQLLLELADELALHAAGSDRADRALTAFRADAARAHEAVSGLREAGGSPLRHAEVARAVDQFGAVLAELGDVLLILDTCEELAKADLGSAAPGDSAPSAVRAALEIIERLHERAPSLRVLFAGRRPLPGRPYLAVQPVAGFTVDEARTYLARFAARPLPKDLMTAIIRQSAAVDAPVPGSGELPDRVSPFDLALYAAWADEDPDLDAARVERGSDAYVEGRIIERLDDPLVERALPVLASAGRCRVATVAAFLGCDPAVLGRRLAQLEWIDADADQPAHVAARPALARRLRRYFESGEQRAGFAAETRRFAAALLARLRENLPTGAPPAEPARVRSVPLTEIDVDELLAALRLAEPADAAALWDAIAERAVEPPGHWGTVLNMTRRILGAWEECGWDETEWPTLPALRATVTAAHIAASRRDSPLFDAEGPWETVRAWAHRHPDPASGQRLLTRAVLGLLPYRPGDESLWLREDGVSARRPLSPDLFLNSAAEAAELGEQAAAYVEAAHRLLEEGLRDAAARLHVELIVGPAPVGQTAWRISAWAGVVVARLLADRDQGGARWALERAERDAISAAQLDEVRQDGRSWPDWIPPDDLLARVRIERGLIAPPENLSVLNEWESYAADRLDTIDGERLASLCLRIRLRHGVVGAAEAERWQAADRYVPDRAPSCTAHDLVPPLFVSVAQAWLSAGEPERALALLDRHRGAALDTRRDQASVRHADAAEVAIVRRLRLTDRQSLLTRHATGHSAAGRGDGDVAGQALRTLGLLGLPLPAATDPRADGPDNWHARWQGEPPSSIQWLFAAQPRTVDWEPARTRVDVSDIEADREELRQLFGSADSAPATGESFQAWDRALTLWLEQQDPPPPPVRTAEPHRELRAAMRMAALAKTRFTSPERVPHRLLAEMAFEEAELTALRLPACAIRLFETAADHYGAAGDALGEVLARVSLLRAGAAAGRAPFLADEYRSLSAALATLRKRNSALAATLTGSAKAAGPWRYWAEAIGEFSAAASRASDEEPDTRGTFSNRGTITVSSAEVGPYAAASARPVGRQLPPPVPPSPGSPSARRAPSARRRTRWVLAFAAAAVAALIAGTALFIASSTPPPPSPAPNASSQSATATPRPTRSLSGGRLQSASSGTANSLAPPPSRQSSSLGATAAPASQRAGNFLTWLIAGLACGLALAGLLAWYGRKAVRLARGRGIGMCRLDALRFDVTPGFDLDVRDFPQGSGPPSTSHATLFLQARLRPWRTAPPRTRRALWLMLPAVRLADLLTRRGDKRHQRKPGYTCTIPVPDFPVSPANLLWGQPRPAARRSWWLRGRATALGIIRVGSREMSAPESMAQPWERIVTAGLDPAAAGRIEWRRIVNGSQPPSSTRTGTAAPHSSSSAKIATAMLLAPPAWERPLRSRYGAVANMDTPVEVLHVIGRATDTAAGPVMAVASDGSAAEGRPAEGWLLGSAPLRRRVSEVVILQAEPGTGAVIGEAPPDDQAEKLRLGAALSLDGVPAVFLLPVVPSGIAGDIAEIIATHAELHRGGAPEVLLTRLRAAIAPHVPPEVLDDVVLFLNESR